MPCVPPLSPSISGPSRDRVLSDALFRPGSTGIDPCALSGVFYLLFSRFISVLPTVPYSELFFRIFSSRFSRTRAEKRYNSCCSVHSLVTTKGEAVYNIGGFSFRIITTSKVLFFISVAGRPVLALLKATGEKRNVLLEPTKVTSAGQHIPLLHGKRSDNSFHTSAVGSKRPPLSLSCCTVSG